MIPYRTLVQKLEAKGYKVVRYYFGTNSEVWNNGRHFITLPIKDLNKNMYKDIINNLVSC
jgi:hypothetical protein